MHAPRPREAPRWIAGETYFAMTGLERVTAFQSGRYPHPAAYQTIGMEPTVVERGYVEYGLGDSGWTAGRDGNLAPGAIAYFLDAPGSESSCAPGS